jgi:uncharacterized protein (TIGR02453 family)
MFSEDPLKFLKALGKNNNREWFQANKEWYDRIKGEFEIFVNLLIGEVGKLDPEVKGIVAKDCVFRIYRDTRFSPDKTPYKTNMGAYMVRGGKKSPFAGYYFHMEPGACFMAGGIWMPPAEILKAVRDEIYHNSDELLAILAKPSFKKHFKEIEGDRLKNAPKDFPPDFEQIDLLKFKSYNLIKYFDDKLLMEKNLLKETGKVFEQMVPFNHFLNKVIEDVA